MKVQPQKISKKWYSNFLPLLTNTKKYSLVAYKHQLNFQKITKWRKQLLTVISKLPDFNHFFVPLFEVFLGRLATVGQDCNVKGNVGSGGRSHFLIVSVSSMFTQPLTSTHLPMPQFSFFFFLHSNCSRLYSWGLCWRFFIAQWGEGLPDS